MLERLAGERPVGHLPDSPSDGGRTPARRLLQRGLLARIDALNVELPREIGLHLRGDRPYGPPRLRPEPAVAAHEQASVDRRAAGAALESVGRIGELLTLLEEEPAGLLRSGGVGVRDQKRLARVLHVGEPEAAWLLELALRRRAARRRRPAPRRVAAHPRLRHLARAGPRRPLGACWPPAGWPASGCRRWSASATSPARRSTRSRPTWSGTPPRRSAASALTVLAEYPPGSGLAPDDLVALLRWRTPRRADRLAPVPAMLAEAARLGVLVGGVLSTAGRGLLARGEDGAADGMRGLLPEPVDHVLAQPDLSLIAPGPLVVRARRHPRRRRRRRVLRRGDGVPGVGVQRAAGARRRLVGVGPARLLHPRLPHPGARRPWTTWSTTSPASTGGCGSARSSPTCAPTTTACSPRCSTTAGPPRPSCAAWPPGSSSAAWAPTRC